MDKDKKLVKILFRIMTFGFYFSIIVAAILVAATIVIQFIPLPEVRESVLQSKFIFDNSFTYEVTVLDNANFLPVITRFLVFGIFSILSLTALTFLLKEVLGNVKNDSVFIEENSQYIKYLGYTIIAVSFIQGALRFWAAAALMNIINIPGGHFGANFSPSIDSIIIGLIIVVLSQIFAYGTHLQNEYDSTI